MPVICAHGPPTWPHPRPPQLAEPLPWGALAKHYGQLLITNSFCFCPGLALRIFRSAFCSTPQGRRCVGGAMPVCGAGLCGGGAGRSACPDPPRRGSDLVVTGDIPLNIPLSRFFFSPECYKLSVHQGHKGAQSGDSDQAQFPAMTLPQRNHVPRAAHAGRPVGPCAGTLCTILAEGADEGSILSVTPFRRSF